MKKNQILSIGATIREAKRGQYFDIPNNFGGGTPVNILASTSARSMQAEVKTRTSGDSCKGLKSDHTRVFITKTAEVAEKVPFTLKNGIALPSDSKGAPSGPRSAKKAKKVAKSAKPAKKAKKSAPVAKAKKSAKKVTARKGKAKLASLADRLK